MEKKKSAVFKLFVATVLASSFVGCLVGGGVVYTITNRVVEEPTQEVTEEPTQEVTYENIFISEPLDCPFCGGEARVYESDFTGCQAFVRCVECRASTYFYSGETTHDASVQALKA